MDSGLDPGLEAEPDWPDRRPSHQLIGTVYVLVPQSACTFDKQGSTYAFDPIALGQAEAAVVYNGQADRDDPARFTIGYALDGRSGVIEGRVFDGANDDVGVDLNLQSSPANQLPEN